MLNEMHLMAREGTIDKYVFLVSSTLISFSVQLAKIKNTPNRVFFRFECELELHFPTDSEGGRGLGA